MRVWGAADACAPAAGIIIVIIIIIINHRGDTPAP